MSDSLRDRGKAMEDVFFKAKDQELLAKLRSEMASDENLKALSAATGITDEKTLDALASSEVTPESATAISLIPLVAVAWADNEMADAEVDAIMKAAVEANVSEGSASYDLLKSWLQTKPPVGLLQAWKHYVNSLKSSLEPAAFGQIQASVMKRATDVAKSAGGFLGLVTISEVEQTVLDDLNKVFG